MIHEPLTSTRRVAPAHWECDVILADGRTVHVRPLGPNDDDRLVAFHAALSDDRVYRRFFSPTPTLNRADSERFTHVDHLRRT